MKQPPVHLALILLGSNILRERNIPLAVQQLAIQPGLHLLKTSSVYESAAVGGSAPQPPFSNCAALVETTLTPQALRRTLRAIEKGMGRVRTADKFAPRPIDLDIVLYDDFAGVVEGSHIPDPDLLRHAHVAVPCAQIAPEWIHPTTGQSLNAISQGVNNSLLRPINELPGMEQRSTIRVETHAHSIGEIEMATPETVMNVHRTNGVNGLHINGHHSNGKNGTGTSESGKKSNGKNGNGLNGSHNGAYSGAQSALAEEAENPFAVPPQESYDPEFEALVAQMLQRLGENPERDGLKRTPLRVAKAMDFLTSGYTMSLEEVVNGALFEAEGQEMVIVRDIEFYSQCEHHMLPFYGKVHIGYIPNEKIIGLSKLARIVDVFARRLQVQERLTSQVADALLEILQPQGVAVVTEASHFCMMMRGVQKQNSFTIASAMRGVFKDNTDTRQEFMKLVTHNR